MPDIGHFSDSDNESFHSFSDQEPSPPRSTQPNSKPNTTNPEPIPARKPPRTSSKTETSEREAEPTRFPPEEEASLLAESNSLKGSGNSHFGNGNYDSAIQTYDRALASCPNYLDYEVAVLRSNIAACHLKLREWKDAVENATKGIERLEALEPLPSLPKKKIKKAGKTDEPEEDEVEEEGAQQVEEVDDKLAERIARLQSSGHTLSSIRTLQTKLLLRRATGNTQLSTWQSLQSASDDYSILLHPVMLSSLSASDRRTVLQNQRALQPKLEEAKEREMAEMMGKLKGLGNSILKPFGLSTENFKFIKDEKTGGYSMSFEQNPGRTGNAEGGG